MQCRAQHKIRTKREERSRSVEGVESDKGREKRTEGKAGVLGQKTHLVFGGITDESFSVSEGHVRRRSSVALVVSNDLYLAVLEDSHARVRGAQVDANSRSCHPVQRRADIRLAMN